MLNLNKVIITGYLTESPKMIAEKRITVFSIGVPTGNKSSIFVKIVAVDDKADFAVRSLAKGTPICVIGSINARDYTTKDGKKARDFYVFAEDLKFILNKPKEETEHMQASTRSEE